MLDDVVVRQRQVEEMELVAGGEDLDVAQLGEAEPGGRVHGAPRVHCAP